MSKKNGAYMALVIKDGMEAYAPIIRRAGIIVGALALLCLNSNIFMTMATIALVVAALYVVTRLIAFISGRAIRGLGFTEPGLERMALA